jgi:uncharacterized membrane protein YphA (DoxX/SURF4 family)
MNPVAAYIAAFVLFYFCMVVVVVLIDMWDSWQGASSREAFSTLLGLAFFLTCMSAAAQAMAKGIINLVTLSF